jgi:tripeptide aminopeptidase
LPPTGSDVDSYTISQKMNELPAVAERFLKYVTFDTTADPESNSVPSSAGQIVLGRYVAEELRALGAADVHHDEQGYVYSRIMPSKGYSGPAIGLLAHLDTSPDAPGRNVRPSVHLPYQGGTISFQAAPELTLSPDIQPDLLKHIGHRLITSDGSTLLGSDDKAGVAIIMQLAEELLANPEVLRPDLRLCFTVDEELGRGVDHLDMERFGADVAYTIDGSGTDVIYCETFNAASAVITFHGRGVHPGYAYGTMINALRALARFIELLPDDEAPETTHDREGYIHPHTVESSDVDRARVRVILRDFDADGLEKRIERVRHLAQDAAASVPHCKVDVEITHEYTNMSQAIDEIDPRVRSFALEAAETMGIDLREAPVRGGTDGARLSELGIPTPNIFNGGHDYHSLFEWNTVENLEHSLAFLHALTARWARL